MLREFGLGLRCALVALLELRPKLFELALGLFNARAGLFFRLVRLAEAALETVQVALERCKLTAQLFKVVGILFRLGLGLGRALERRLLLRCLFLGLGTGRRRVRPRLFQLALRRFQHLSLVLVFFCQRRKRLDALAQLVDLLLELLALFARGLELPFDLRCAPPLLPSLFLRGTR